MPPAGAPDGDGQVRLALPNIPRQQETEQRFNAPQERRGFRYAQQKARNPRVSTRIGTQFGLEMRVGQESHIEYKVGFRRNAVAIAKTHQRQLYPPPPGFLKPFHDELAQIVHRKVAGINDHIGKAADGCHQLALAPDALGDGAFAGQRMGASGLAEASQQSFITGFDEHQRDWILFFEAVVHRRQLLQLLPFARIHQQGCPRVFPSHREFTEGGNQIDRQVVDTVVPQILEGLQNGPLARATEAGQQNQLAGSFAGTASDGSVQAFHVRWRRRWVLGMPISSRYLATVRRVTWMPCSASRRAISSSVRGWRGSSSSIILRTRRLREARAT